MLVAESPIADPRCHALVALLALQAARIPARVDENGELVLLEHQDRSKWDRQLLMLGHYHLAASAEGETISSYHVQAGIASMHAHAPDPESTDWDGILLLYDDLLALNPSAVVALNRAIAVSKVRGPEAALREIALIQDDPALANYYLLPATRGRLLAELGEREAAAKSFREALNRKCSEPERRFLLRRLAECEL
jgi:RNA polymerase sigma-70 factor (ECF subfamily)